MIQVTAERIVSISVNHPEMVMYHTNKIIEKYYNAIMPDVLNKRCSKCGNSKGSIKIHVNTDMFIVYSKSNFCCREFEDSIQFKYPSI